MIALISSLLFLTAQATEAPVWTPAPAPDGVVVMTGAVEAPDCGRLIRTPAYCVGSTLGAIGGVAEAYVADLEGKGWIPADGDDNRVIFVRRKAQGGCDAMQMQLFYDESKMATAESAGYLAFAVIPRDICQAAPPATNP